MWIQSLGQEDPRRRKWQPTPVISSGKSHGQRSLMGYSLYYHRIRHDLATKQQLQLSCSEDNPKCLPRFFSGPIPHRFLLQVIPQTRQSYEKWLCLVSKTSEGCPTALTGHLDLDCLQSFLGALGNLPFLTMAHMLYLSAGKCSHIHPYL